jgi:pimeloyl-ACP methyl ester carboxylesterase
MSVSVDAVKFANRSGEALFGIFHEPDLRQTDVAILLLSPGVKSRVAPHRLYYKAANRFARLGFPVFRFDFAGLGDSGGHVPIQTLADLYASIQVGRYVEDTVAAMDFLQKTHGIRRVIAAGLCGGAITGLLAASRDARVIGLLGLGLPVMLDTPGVDSSRYMTSGQLRGIRAKYFRKLATPGAWRRLLTFQTNYRLLVRSLVTPVRRRFERTKAAATSAPPPETNANPLFPPAMLSILADRRPVLLLFGGADRLHWEYEEKFVALHRDALRRHALALDVRVISNGNHVLTFPEWQEELFDLSERWLRDRFPTNVAQHTPVVHLADARG